MQLTDEQFYKLFPFDYPRQNQREIINRILTAYKNGKKHVILNAPTGSGKSAISYTIAKYFKSAYILTSQKILQEQYKQELNIPFILGKANYQCAKDFKLNCELGECKGKMICGINCPYIQERDTAITTPISNFNYSYFLMINRKNNFHLPKRELIILDECHNTESQLINTSTITISRNILDKIGMKDIDLPKENDTYKEKIIWLLKIFLPRIEQEYQILKDNINRCNQFNFKKQSKLYAAKYALFGLFLDSIEQIKEQLLFKQQIVISFNQKINSIEYKTLYGNKLFKKMIEPYGNIYLHMSATILDKNNYCSVLGLIPNEVEYISVESLFPIENRPIYFEPIGSLTMKNKFNTIPKLIEKIKEIMKKYPNEKGIIHTINYQIADIIIDQLYGSDQGNRLLKPQGNNRQAILNTFYLSKNPYVLISPSLTEGLNLKDDLSRFCIICKVPYASINNDWIKKRIEKDSKWYNIHTAETLIQMSGRSIRTETDHADTYILDSNFLEFAKRSYYLFPQWWKDSVINNS